MVLQLVGGQGENGPLDRAEQVERPVQAGQDERLERAGLLDGTPQQRLEVMAVCPVEARTGFDVRLDGTDILGRQQPLVDALHGKLP